MDFIFDCPACARALVARAAQAGLQLPCPHCAAQIPVQGGVEVTDFTSAPGVRRVLSGRTIEPGVAVLVESAAPSASPVSPRRARSALPEGDVLQQALGELEACRRQIKVLRAELQSAQLEASECRSRLDETTAALAAAEREMALDRETAQQLVVGLEQRCRALDRQLDRVLRASAQKPQT